LRRSIQTLRVGYLAFTLACPAAGVAAAEVREFMLDNGLKLIVQEDHRASVVVSEVWYKVGSSYEHEGITGVSHALEHMMFQGTERHPAGEFSRLISASGGEENAFTGSDYTAYFQTMAKENLSLSFELEADRMRGLALPEQEFAKEIKVVMEERRLRTDDKPESLMAETAMAVAFETSPYRHPVIGWMHDLEAMTVADLRAWYERWYAPNNATLVVVGDVEPGTVFDLAKRYFGPLVSGQRPAPKPAREVAQKGQRRATVREVARLPQLLMAYKVPVLTSAVANPAEIPRGEVFALEVLADLLSGGDSARLPRHLVREQEVAASADVGYNLGDRLESLFTLEAVPAEGRDPKALESALRREIERLRSESVPAAEIDRVKARVIARKVFELDSMFYQAMQIGFLESVGLDWRLKDQYLDAVKAVTAEEVRAVATKYLIDERLTVAVLEPLPAPPAGRK
jgi:zinc protease